jgi:hypothetical protein
MDNADILKALDLWLEKNPSTSVKVNRAFSDPYGDYMSVTLMDYSKKADVTGYGDEVVAGIRITNSETGLAALTIQPFVWRMVCKNGLVAPVALEDGKRRFIHSGKRDYRHTIPYLAGAVLESTEKVIDTMKLSVESPIVHVNGTIHNLTKRFKLPDSTREKIENAFVTDPMATKYGIVNAFTKAAQEFKDIERDKMEAYGGKILMMNSLRIYDKEVA